MAILLNIFFIVLIIFCVYIGYKFFFSTNEIIIDKFISTYGAKAINPTKIVSLDNDITNVDSFERNFIRMRMNRSDKLNK
jgi:hypothetical protein